MTTLQYLVDHYQLDLNQPSPIEIANVGRDQLAHIFAQLGFTRGVEIGTERGVYAEVLCLANPQLELHCIDPWERYAHYRTYISQTKIEQFYEEAKQRLGKYNCRLVKNYSFQAVNQFANDSLDFVYIDGNHSFESVLQDIEIWSPKIKSGGIISGHDYIQRKEPTTHHVIQAVHTYVATHQIQPWFLLGRKYAPDGEIRDKTRSWMWVNTRA